MICRTTSGELHGDLDRLRDSRELTKLAPGFLLVGWIALALNLAGCTSSSISRDVPSELRNSIGMALVRIPAGEFQMGSDRQSGESVPSAPQHSVAISHGFYLGKFEVTQAEYAQVMGANTS